MKTIIETNQKSRNFIIKLKYGLIKAFDKDVFTEEEIQNEEFYTALRLNCGECFETKDGMFNQDLFWSDYTRDIITGKISI